MAKETELKLTLPPAALARLRQHPLLAAVKPARFRLENTYYDTPDFALKQRRIALRHRRTRWGWLLTVKSAEPAAGALAQRSEWEAPSQPGEFNFSHVDNTALRRELEALAPPLTPIFSTDFLRTTWVIAPAAGTRIEVALDRGEVRCGERMAPICEVELELLEGDVSALFDVALALQAQVPLRPAAASKAERGLALFAGEAPAPVRAGKSAVTEAMTPVAAFKAVAFECLDQIQRNEAGALQGENPEYLHQLRVAIRRLRAALRFWKPILPTAFMAAYAAPWSAVAQTIGDARNWDVLATQTLPPLLDGFPSHRCIVGLKAHAEKHRRIAQRAVHATLSTPEFAHLMLAFSAAVHALPDSPGCEPLARFARGRLKRFYGDVQALAEALDADPEAHHRLRIGIKRLRYALEFVGPLYRRRRVRRFLGGASELQELLGAMNDIAVARLLIAEHRRLGADDLVTGWLAGRSELLRRLLPSALTAFRLASRPWKSTR